MYRATRGRASRARPPCWLYLFAYIFDFFDKYVKTLFSGTIFGIGLPVLFLALARAGPRYYFRLPCIFS